MKISALVLAKNEEEMIEPCLSQLTFADEIIVLDQKSQDRTAQIARQFTKKVYETEKTNFDDNRNYLKSRATGEWLLYVDADERLSEELVAEIKNSAKDSKFAAFYFPRKNFILGKWVRHGGWWPDYSPRLFKNKNLLRWEGNVHETPVIEGNFGYFQNALTHISARSVSQMFSKSIKWAKIESELYDKAAYPKINIMRVVKAMTREFIARFIVKQGFLDGTVGLVEAIYQSLHQAMILTYLWEKRNVKNK